MRHDSFRAVTCLAGACLAALASLANAQQAAPTSPPTPRPPDKPPIAQGWIDLATFSSPGMPAGMGAMMPGGAPGGSPLAGMFGSKAAQGNQFGLTQAGGSGRYVDVTVRTRLTPALAEAVQTVPDTSGLAPKLQLKVLPESRPVADESEETVVPPGEPPKARIRLYWGCGPAVRAGQPKVLDFNTATAAELADVFKARRATQRGAHSAPGRPVWPNPQDPRRVPDTASFTGAHAFTGQGIPESFRFTLPAAQDLMPPIALKQDVVDGVTHLSWTALPTARAYFVAAMGGGATSDGTAEMTLWTSSELPDTGLGLIDYQTNRSVDQWLKEKVLLAPATTQCDVPKGMFPADGGAMLRMIAYGSELNLAHPPRPKDTTVAWEPEWALKVRVKSVANAMLGLSMPEMTGPEGLDEAASPDPADPAAAPEETPKKKKKFSLKDAIDAVKQNVPVP